MKGTIITIGDEILIGQIVDTNSTWLGSEMSLMGIEVTNMRTIPDQDKAIRDALDNALATSDLIVMTGGLGPTKDDITKKSISDYVGSEMVFHQELSDRIEAYFKSRNYPFLEAHRQQCYMPQEATLLENKMGTAPGMLFQYKGKYILSMPGVPHEMKWIFEHSFKPVFSELSDSEYHIYHRTIMTAGMGESRIASMIEDIVDTLPSDISMSYLPSLGRVKLRLTVRSKEDKSALVDEYITKIVCRIPDLVYGYDGISLAEALQNLMIEKGLKLATAESCTGGYLAHKLTEVPGSSAYYMGSIIAYDYEPKKQLLQVTPNTLEQYGAVSEETVREMLTGLFTKFDVDLGIAISGIAGPGGGLPEKPVGTIWLAWGDQSNIETHKLLLSKARKKNIEYTAGFATNVLRKYVLDKG